MEPRAHTDGSEMVEARAHLVVWQVQMEWIDFIRPTDVSCYGVVVKQPPTPSLRPHHT